MEEEGVKDLTKTLVSTRSLILEKAVLTNDAGPPKWQLGFCFVDDTPPTPEATEELLNRIAFIRSTHYGAFWDFTSDLSSKDTAYTALALPLHTDTTYFTDPAGLQMFHCLSHTLPSSSHATQSSLGGQSTLLDGFSAASHLHTQSPHHYSTLSTIPVPTHSSGEPTLSITPALRSAGFPVFNHDPPSSIPTPGALTQIRWNNDDRATKTSWESPQQMAQWYAAAQAWTNILRDEGNVLRFKLEPGRPLIFDNWRMLHGREAFVGKRRVCGGYRRRDRSSPFDDDISRERANFGFLRVALVNYDDFLSRYLMTNFGREDILRRI
ncbi:MAG: hypothetical protein Q9227_001795 [Pyrenula ochraceoflavens]